MDISGLRLQFRAIAFVLLCILAPQNDGVAEETKERKSSTEEAGRRVGEHHRKSSEQKKDYELPASSSQDDQGRPLLSWRVKILPQLGYPNLYDAFHHDEAWDSRHNRTLIAKMPRIYQTAAPVRNGNTTIMALVSEDSAITSEGGGIRLSQVTDGASHTIMFVSADPDQAVTWTRPEDIPFDPENPFEGLDDNGRFQAVMVDGSVHTIPTTIGKETMRRLVYRNDGKPVSVNFR